MLNNRKDVSTLYNPTALSITKAAKYIFMINSTNTAQTRSILTSHPFLSNSFNLKY